MSNYNKNMNNSIDDIVIPILRTLQADVSAMKSDMADLKERTAKIDIHLGIVKSHMTGFMSSAKYLETEIDELRGRVEALERRDQPPSPAE